MQQLEAEGELERDVEFLPTTEEMAERRAAGPGMDAPGALRPARVREALLQAALLRVRPAGHAYLERELARYFPPRSSSGSATCSPSTR